ncbi:hypothetical protein IGI04_020717 [Brassica rapa subsp. trilocularis]|uniref:Uncharacterized protein n=1 Tax=Brassica rapa subsp. trilocularis TaxID=1813537 RepID=A0ABQ7MJI0_BRACM|nr:hypothetical protein IGI04_020717 [Brassica rapa subsp. trilocularis]
MKHSLPNGHNQLVSHTFRLLVILSFFFCFSRLAGREDSYTVEEKILKLQKKKEVVFEGQDRWWFSGGYRKVDSGRYVLYSLVLL